VDDDVHERMIADEKLRQDEQELRRITHAIPIGIHLLRPDGSVPSCKSSGVGLLRPCLENALVADYMAPVLTF
jgi:hypothetical protein